MSDGPAISLSYSTTTAASTGRDNGLGGSAADPALVAFATCELIPVDGQVTLMINRENGRQQLAASQVVEALKTCTHFDTVARHAQRLCATRPGLRGQEQGVEATLEKLRREGFFLEANTVAERLNAHAGKNRAPTRVCVLTCDRPDAVERLLESMLQTADLTIHEALFLIDDSRDPGNQRRNAEIVEGFSTRSARSMRYVGPVEQRALLDALVEQLPLHETGIRFLIDRDAWGAHPTYGRTRTLALLMTVGCRAIVLDDDILCLAVRPAVPEAGIAVGVEHGRAASFFQNRDELMANAVTMAESPLALHARYLGASLGETVRGLNGGDLTAAQLRDSNAAMTNIWRADSPVLVTQSGAWGDPGTEDAHWTLHLDEYSISRLLAAPQGIARAIEDRCVWLGSARPTIIKTAYMSQMTGLDNAALLPPYFPAFRGEDLLFASMLEAMHPRGAVLENGFAVPHLPDRRQRRTLRDPITGAGSIGLFAAYLTNRIDYTDGNEPAHRMAMIAQDLRRLAEKSTADLLMDYRREIARAQTFSLYQLTEQQRLTQDMNSANWSAYLDRGITEIQQALQREWSPTDIEGTPAGASAAELVEVFRGYLRGFATALEAWPAIRRAAAGLAADY